MSMASYNLLKAAADGLAEAIRYKTNLKRQRQEEQYNYNRDFERNENEYQRDLQRKKDWLDYTTDYDWKQMEKKDKYNRDKTLRYEKEDIGRKLGYLDELPKNIDLYSPSAVNDYNDVRGVYGLGPVAVQKKEKPYEQILKEKEDELKLRFKYHNMQGQADLAKDKALASYRNSLRPAGKNPYEQLLDIAQRVSKETGIPLDQAIALVKSGKLGGMPSSVKGGSGNSAIGGFNDNYYKSLVDSKNNAYNKFLEVRRNTKPDVAKFIDSRFAILQDEKATDEQKKQAEAELDKAFQTNKDFYNKDLQDAYLSVKEYNNMLRDYVRTHRQGYDYDFNKGGMYLARTDIENTKNMFGNDPALTNAEERYPNINPQPPQMASSTVLYSENAQPVYGTNIMPEIMPQDIPPMNFSPNASDSIPLSIDRNSLSTIRPINEVLAMQKEKAELDRLYSNGAISREDYIRALVNLNSFGGRK